MNKKKYYHGSPNKGIEVLREGSYITPDMSIARLMGLYHMDTGKTWDDSDLEEAHFLGTEPKWKKEPKGEPDIYELELDEEDIDTLDNPYEHKLKKEKRVTKHKKEASTADFIPDYKPEDIQDSYNAIYGHYGPRLASMDKWPDEWINKDVDSMGWLQWYEQYKAGRRTEDDDRQIKRWKSFKARHGSQFKKNPTPRRAFALRNWAIDPLKLIDDEEVRGQLAKAMETYKQTAWDKYNSNNYIT